MKNPDENDKNFDFIGLLKKAIFFDFINKSLFSFGKEISDIKDSDVNIDNLRFSPVEITRNSKLSSFVYCKYVCINAKNVANTSPLSQVIKLPNCNYTTNQIVSFKITTGLNKTNDNKQQPTKPILNVEDAMVVFDFLNLNDASNFQRKSMLSNSLDLSNLNEYRQEIDSRNFSAKIHEIVIPPKQQIVVKYKVRVFTLKTNLNLKQKINGIIVAKVTINSDEHIIQISIKDAMLILQKYSLLPSEIIINPDKSITFNGKATLTSILENKPKIIRNFLNVK